jgi:16S rRNA (uracil1498-N3)-methyltransferase
MSVRAPVAKLASGERTLSAESSQYLCRVLRLREGERFVAFDPESRTEAEATILEASGSAARVTIGECHAASVVAETPVALVYGLAKGDKVDTVVRDATELGATRIVIARTTRAVAKLDGERAGTKVDRWRRIAEQAARQCGRADPPAVDGVLDWREALAVASADEAAGSAPPRCARAPRRDRLRDRSRGRADGGRGRRGARTRLRAGFSRPFHPSHGDGRRGGAGRSPHPDRPVT